MINTDIFMIVGIVIFAIALAIGIRKLMEHKKIQQEDLRFVVSLFNLSLSIVDELDLKSENHIKELGRIVQDSLNFCIELTNTEEINEKATLYAYNMCSDLGIKLNDNRKQIISVLIQMGIKDKFIN